ncbi:MAG: NmrA/HSCARG family protein, partial [Nitrospira sp.]|nr:NmrA/HSCARG family protein [Nitrospira sp.]
MAEKRIIAVVGATGAQGGGLVRAIVGDRTRGFAVRALTRDTGSDKAKALVKLGADVVAADLDDVESLKRAFTGCDGAFCLTNFWEHFSPEKEVAQAKALAQAAKQAGVRHVVWSTLEDTRRWVPIADQRMPTLMERYKVPHFDGKGEADAEFTKLGVPTTFLLTSFYWENMIFFGMGPQRGSDGQLTLSLPMGDKKLPGIVVEDIGKCCFAIFQREQEFIGKTVGIAGEHLTGQEMATAMTEALGQTVMYNSVPFEVYRKLGFAGA